MARQAARAAWIAPIVMVITNRVLEKTLLEEGIAGAWVMVAINALLLLTGIGAGIFALTQVRKAGRPGVLTPGLTGLIVSVLLLSIFATNFESGYHRGRSRRDAKRRSQAFLSQVAARVNQTLPKRIDEETELVSTAGLESTFVYNYRLVHLTASEVDVERLRESLRRQVASGACTRPEMREQFLDRGVRLRFVYNDKDGAQVVSFDLTAADCPTTPAGAARR
jgi:hypothetical protein